jgi:hypothetical protein
MACHLGFLAISPAKLDGLECRLAASAPEQREALKGAVSRHVDRFAFREAAFAFA